MPKSPKPPPKPVCSLCGHDDYVTTLYLGDGVYQFSCDSSAHSQPWIKEESAHGGLDDLQLEGLALEWGLYDDLPKCLTTGEPFVEYGVVEHRYKQLNPIQYRNLVERYGHTCIAPSRYTASAFIGSALGRLLRRGDLDARHGEATGRWLYNSSISYWALPSIDPSEEMVTWKTFAENEGLDPEIWTVA